MKTSTFVSVTSQGQLSIPAQFRQALNMQLPQKMSITLQGNQIILKPVRKLSDLAGCLQGKPADSSQNYHQAFEDFVAQDAENDATNSTI